VAWRQWLRRGGYRQRDVLAIAHVWIMEGLYDKDMSRSEPLALKMARTHSRKEDGIAKTA